MVVVKRGFHLAHEAVVFAVQKAVVMPDFAAALNDAFTYRANDTGWMVKEAIRQLCTKVVRFESHATASASGSEPPIVVPPAIKATTLIGITSGLEVVATVDALQAGPVQGAHEFIVIGHRGRGFTKVVLCYVKDPVVADCIVTLGAIQHFSRHIRSSRAGNR
jgi:hypothetical protein